MKKSRIEHVKKYSMLSLIEDLGFTLVYESSNYYHLEEHDSLKIRVNINRFYWYSKGFGGDTITLCQTLGLEKSPEFNSFIYREPTTTVISNFIFSQKISVYTLYFVIQRSLLPV